MTAKKDPTTLFGTDHLREDLTRRSVRGGFTTVISQGIQFLFTTASTIVLARLLVPADFGVVAMVTAITALGQGFADLGLSEATIQRENITHRQVSTLFWINVAIGVALMLLTAGMAPVLTWFYRDPRLVSITLLASLTFLVGGLRVQHDALLRRQMRFRALALRDMLSTAVGVLVGVTTAWKGAGYWAILIVPLVTNFTQMTLSWSMVRWIPGLPQRDADVGSMISFGGKVATSYVMLNFLKSVDQILIGRYWGPAPLGLYSRAYNLLTLPTRQLQIPVSAVAVPAFSRIHGDRDRFARFYLRTINLMVWITAPIFAFLFVAAEPVIVIVLGTRWRDAAPIFKILAVSALAQVLHGSTIWVFVSRGESGRLLKLTGLISPVLIASYLVGLPFGVTGVALTGSVFLIGIVPWMLHYTFRGTQLNLGRVGRALICPVSLCLAGIILARAALFFIAPQRVISQLLVTAGGFASAYLLACPLPAVKREALSLKDLWTDGAVPTSRDHHSNENSGGRGTDLPKQVGAEGLASKSKTVRCIEV
jgi:PST family polysaccharide transporter